MREHRPEVADVFRDFEDNFLDRYSTSGGQRKVLRDIVACRTAVLGGHVRKCDHCEHLEISYNSCRNRHCPKCQSKRTAEWLDAQAASLLNVDYFHVVFTVPEAVGPIALQNQKIVYGILFRAVAETLLTIARDPKHLGAQIGFLSILHTWGQTLQHHPHIHCLVPAGGLSADGTRWVDCRPGFFLSVRVLSCLFQKKLLYYLRNAYRQRKLSFHGKLHHLSQSPAWNRYLKTLEQTAWVVYSKPPFGGSEQVLKYLARYTHRVAISNRRLISLDSDQVTFRWKDYRHHHRQRTMTLDATEFIRRFLQHVLPSGFMRIRHYGFLANRCRNAKLALCRRLLAENRSSQNPAQIPQAALQPNPEPDSCPLCPACKNGHMRLIETFKTRPSWAPQRFPVQAYDTS